MHININYYYIIFLLVLYVTLLEKIAYLLCYFFSFILICFITNGSTILNVF